jgi:DNA polymerase-3 subunit gamma/tau
MRAGKSMLMESLDRKYRPRVLEEVVGQKNAVRQLSLLIRQARPPSLIVHGPWGAGKTTLARIYAQALNCAGPTDTGSPLPYV